MESGNVMSRLYNITDWILLFLITNVLWIVFSSPLLLFGAYVFSIEDSNILYALIIMTAVTLPLILFPATTAMFASIRNWVFNDREAPIIKSYWKFYKENYKKSAMGGFVFWLIWFIFVVDYYFFTTYVSKFFAILFLFLLIYLVLFTLNFFSSIVHFDSTFWQSLKNALFITLGSPLLTILLAAVISIVIYISVFYLTFLIPLFTMSLIAFISFSGFNQAIQKRLKLTESK